MPSIQLFDPTTRAYTYLVHDSATREALVIDPIAERHGRDMAMLAHERLKLTWIVETQAHVDYLSGAAQLMAATGAQLAAPATSGIAGARQLQDGDMMAAGSVLLRVLATPGHSADSICLLRAAPGGGGHAFLYSGNTLLIGGCGRTDLPTSDAGVLYDSITTRLFTLPLDTRIWPGRDENERGQSTVALERATNGDVVGRTRAEFVAWMAARTWPPLSDIEGTLAANRRMGVPVAVGQG